MKVYGGTFFDWRGVQVRGVIAATRKEAAQKLGINQNHFNNYWAETSNNDELRIALDKPGTLFWCENRFHDRNYQEY